MYISILKKSFFLTSFVFLFLSFCADFTKENGFIIAVSKAEAKTNSATEKAYQKARTSYYSLLGSSSKMQKRIEWEKTIRLFAHVEKNYPKTSRAKDALYTIGLLYSKLARFSGYKKDNQKAIDYFNALLKRFPKSNLADDSLENIADIEFRFKKVSNAKLKYQQSEKLQSKNSKGKKNRAAARVDINKIEHFVGKRYARVVIKLSRKTSFSEAVLDNPKRLFVDLLNTKIPTAISKERELKDLIIKSIRTSQKDNDVSRIVIDLNREDSYYKITSFGKPFMIVIDIGVEEKLKNGISVANRSKGYGSVRESYRDNLSLSNLKLDREKVIVIDPGHGGRDSGAVGKTGLKEKNLTLKLANIVAGILRKQTDYKIVLTRSSDKYLSLDERTVMANSLNAELFVSIHINANKNKKVKGLETYFLSPARSNDELEISARENMAALGGKGELQDDLVYIMSDLSNTQKVNDSYNFAKTVQMQISNGNSGGRHNTFSDNGIKQAMFYVLWRANMPSILIEAGYISNKEEEKELRSNRRLRQIGGSIADGIKKFISNQLVASR